MSIYQERSSTSTLTMHVARVFGWNAFIAQLTSKALMINVQNVRVSAHCRCLPRNAKAERQKGELFMNILSDGVVLGPDVDSVGSRVCPERRPAQWREVASVTPRSYGNLNSS